jgi:uncharacterized protein YjbI with pentapeptide repeats
MSDANKPALKAANDNPWYCLATMYDELPAQERDVLVVKNRLAWNRWIATGLSDEGRASLVKNGFPEPELAPLSPEEERAFCRAFAVRTGRKEELPPEPAATPDFTFTQFDRNVEFQGFLLRDADFKSAVFSGGADFTSATFFDANFSSALFSGGAIFKSATFSGHTAFNSATFAGADFDSATFSDYAAFVSAKFSYEAYFNSTTFSGPANFCEATFSYHTAFNSARFRGGAEFNSTTFSKTAHFISATFSDDAYFHWATFSDAMFTSATFSGRTSFLGAKFSNLASSSATFSGETSFHLVTISNFADFGSATFSNYAIFGSTKFTGEDPTFSKSADFSSATFSKLACFGSANFSKSAEFISATFAGPTDLSSIKFCGDANFASARFSAWSTLSTQTSLRERRSPEQSLETRCPIFAGRQCTRPPNGMAQFGQSPGTTEMPRNRRSMPMNASSRRWSASRSTRMSSVFFGKELRARRRLESPLSAARLLNFLYEALSDYGQSIGRAASLDRGVFCNRLFCFCWYARVQWNAPDQSGCGGLEFCKYFLIPAHQARNHDA